MNKKITYHYLGKVLPFLLHFEQLLLVEYRELLLLFRSIPDPGARAIEAHIIDDSFFMIAMVFSYNYEYF